MSRKNNASRVGRQALVQPTGSRPDHDTSDLVTTGETWDVLGIICSDFHFVDRGKKKTLITKNCFF